VYGEAITKADKVSKHVVKKEKDWLKKSGYKKPLPTNDTLSTNQEATKLLKSVNKAFGSTLKAVDKSSERKLAEQAKQKLEAVDDMAQNETNKMKNEEKKVEGKFDDKVAPNIDEKEQNEKITEEEEKQEEKKVDSELAAEELSDPERNEREEPGMETFSAELDSAGEKQKEEDKEESTSDKHKPEHEKEEEDNSPLGYHWSKVKGPRETGTDARLGKARLDMHWHTVETDTPDDIMSDIFGPDK